MKAWNRYCKPLDYELAVSLEKHIYDENDYEYQQVLYNKDLLNEADDIDDFMPCYL